MSLLPGSGAPAQDLGSSRYELSGIRAIAEFTGLPAFLSLLPGMLQSGCDLQVTASLRLLCDSTRMISGDRATPIRRLVLPFLHDVFRRLPCHNLHSELAVTALHQLFPSSSRLAQSEEAHVEYCSQLLQLAQLASHGIPPETWHNLSGLIVQATMIGVHTAHTAVESVRPLMCFFVGLLHAGARQRRWAMMVLYHMFGAPDTNRLSRNDWIPSAFIERLLALESDRPQPADPRHSFQRLYRCIDDVASALASYHEQSISLPQFAIQLSTLIQTDPLCVGAELIRWSDDPTHETEFWPVLLLRASQALSAARPPAGVDDASVAEDVLLIQHHLLRHDMEEAAALAEIAERRHPSVFWFSYAYSEAARAPQNIPSVSRLARLRERVAEDPTLRDSPAFMMWQRNVLESYVHCAFKISQTATARQEWDSVCVCLEHVEGIVGEFSPSRIMQGRDESTIIASQLLCQLVGEGRGGLDDLQVSTRRLLSRHLAEASV